MKDIELIINPHAGRGEGAAAGPQIARALTYAGFNCEARLTNGPRHAAELAENAARRGFDYVAIAGGDGSINEAVNGIMRAGTNTPLAIMPVGTGNDFVKMLRANSWQDTLAALEEGRTRQVDVGRCNDSYFANGIGVGFDAKVAKIANQTRWLRGKSVYFAGVFRAIAFHHGNPEMRITLDDHTFVQRVTMLSAANGQVYGGSFRVAPDARIDDGYLDIIIAGDVSRTRMLGFLPSVLKGTHTAHELVSTHRSKKLLIEATEPLPIHADGELFAEDPTRIEIETLAGQLTLVD
ncbi:MAG: diacylglycerol kinase family lipid kinase [Gammaproteobacteria bacterium]|nr:diacylglycerol kinase family lipid kinase [Gammaproteobacteria bacterium]